MSSRQPARRELGDGWLDPEEGSALQSSVFFSGGYPLAVLESKVKSQVPGSQRAMHFNFNSGLKIF